MLILNDSNLEDGRQIRNANFWSPVEGLRDLKIETFEPRGRPPVAPGAVTTPLNEYIELHHSAMNIVWIATRKRGRRKVETLMNIQRRQNI